MRTASAATGNVRPAASKACFHKSDGMESSGLKPREIKMTLLAMERRRVNERQRKQPFGGYNRQDADTDA